MALQPTIKQAVAAEIDYEKSEKKRRQGLSPTELRTMGIAVFPLNCKKANDVAGTLFLTLQASFHINDQFFYNGCKLVIHVNDQRLSARLNALAASEMEIRLADEIDFNPLNFTYRVDFESDDKTFKCMELGIQLLETRPDLQAFETDLQLHKESFAPFPSHKLNESQQKAVSALLSDNKTVCIQGPPGTGKTTTLVQAITELTKKGKQVIVSAPSNTAVDTICRKLIDEKIALVRLGNDEKIHSEVLPFTIDGHLEKTQGKAIEHMRKAMRKAVQIVTRSVRNYTPEAKQEKSAARKELQQLRGEIRGMEKQLFQHLIETIPVIAGTPVSLFNHLSKEKQSDIVIIDEAGQCLSPLAWLAASFGKRLVLCGDPQQLPPVVFSPKAQSLGLSESLLEAAFKVAQPILLQTQYRMGEEVVGAINSYFYNNELHTSPGNPAANFYFVDMAGYGDGELKDEITGSTYNLGEVELVQKVIAHFKFEAKNTVVLSPYNAQLEEIAHTLDKVWRISTIDSMQGQEATNIIISLTRSNENSELGFLKDYRRSNVAISRAKEMCVVIGDSSTLGSDKFYSQLIDYAEQLGNYKSAYELLG